MRDIYIINELYNILKISTMYTNYIYTKYDTQPGDCLISLKN